MKSEWNSVKLGEVVNFNTGKLDSNQAEDNGVYPFFTCSPITLSINREAFDTEAVLLAGNNANGVFSVKYYKGKFNAYQRTYVVTPKDRSEISTKWLYFRIKHVTKELQQLSVGSATKFLTKKILDNFEIKLPDIDAQNKIANVLWSLENKIELNRKMNETLEAMAQALFKSWFVDFDPVHLKAKCTSEEELEAGAKELGISKEVLELFPSAFVESEMGMIPLGWEVKTLTDVVDFQNGYSFKSKELHDDRKNSIKVFKMGHIHRGGGFKEEGKDTYFYNTDPDKMSKYLLEKGDVLMAMTDMKANMALLAHTALMPHTNRYLLNQRVGRLRVKDASILGYPYVYVFSNYPDTIHDLRSRSNSGVQVNLTTKAILDTEIIVPEQKVHAEFNKETLALYEKIFANNEEIVSLKRTRDTLLPKLLSGELDVTKLKIVEEN